MTIAYWISPKGEIMVVQRGKHISDVIAYPEKFGFNKEFIEYVYNFYNEKIGTEGKAREQIMITLFNKGWVRIRRYKNFWSINVKRLAGKTKDYVTIWAKKVLKGLNGFKEDDYYIDVKIDQKNKPIKTVQLQSIADSNKFISENILISKNYEDLKNLPLYDIVYEVMGKRKTFKQYLQEN